MAQFNSNTNLNNNTNVNANANVNNNQLRANPSATATSGGNTQTNKYEHDRSAPAFGLGGLASGPCTGISGGFALTTPVGGGGVYGADEDEECTKRETARVLFSLGMIDEAKAVAYTFGPLQDIKEAQAETAKVEAATATSPAPSTSVAATSPSYDPIDQGCHLNPDLVEAMGGKC